MDPSKYLGENLKLAINAVSAKMGGAVTYLTNVLRCLPPPQSSLEFLVFLPPEVAEKLAGLPPNVRLMPTKVGYEGWRKRIWWEQTTLRQWLKRHKVDLLFSAANFGMFRCPVRQILLVRNALYFSDVYQREFLARHSVGMKARFRIRRWLICRSIQSADVVITPTRSMLNDLSKFVDVKPEKTLVNPFGVAVPNSSTSAAGGTRPAAVARDGPAVKLVYVSLYAEHKNLTTLLKAMSLLNGNGTRKFQLITTADPAWEKASWTVTHRSDLALARRPEVAPWVKFVGPLEPQQTLELYRQGDLFVFPSLCESFGHPMVEAMMHGLPVIASDTPVNREICGDAAVYFHPMRSQDLVSQVLRVAEDAQLRQKLSMAAHLRACGHFRWSEHVERLLRKAQQLIPESPTWLLGSADQMAAGQPL